MAVFMFKTNFSIKIIAVKSVCLDKKTKKKSRIADDFKTNFEEFQHHSWLCISAVKIEKHILDFG